MTAPEREELLNRTLVEMMSDDEWDVIYGAAKASKGHPCHKKIVSMIRKNPALLDQFKNYASTKEKRLKPMPKNERPWAKNDVLSAIAFGSSSSKVRLILEDPKNSNIPTNFLISFLASRMIDWQSRALDGLAGRDDIPFTSLLQILELGFLDLPRVIKERIVELAGTVVEDRKPLDFLRKCFLSHDRDVVNAAVKTLGEDIFKITDKDFLDALSYWWDGANRYSMKCLPPENLIHAFSKKPSLLPGYIYPFLNSDYMSIRLAAIDALDNRDVSEEFIDENMKKYTGNINKLATYAELGRRHGYDRHMHVIEPPETVYKRCRGAITVEAHIPEDAEIRGNRVDNRFRASKAIITDIVGKYPVGMSIFDPTVTYVKGDVVEIPNFDLYEDSYGTGFHFFCCIKSL